MQSWCPGTLVCMPSEVLKEHPCYGTEIDVYSYGVLGFHKFSGKWQLLRGSVKMMALGHVLIQRDALSI